MSIRDGTCFTLPARMIAAVRSFNSFSSSGPFNAIKIPLTLLVKSLELMDMKSVRKQVKTLNFPKQFLNSFLINTAILAPNHMLKTAVLL